VTSQDVDTWLRAAKERRAHLHLLAALSPWQSDQRQEAFTALSALLQEALEEVRVVSESTRAWSQTVRGTSTDLRTHATQLRARSAAVLDRLAPFAPPPPEAIHEAESQLLALFKGGTEPRTSSAPTIEPSWYTEEGQVITSSIVHSTGHKPPPVEAEGEERPMTDVAEQLVHLLTTLGALAASAVAPLDRPDTGPRSAWLEAAPLPVLVTDQWGHISEMNQAAAALFRVRRPWRMRKPLVAFIAVPEQYGFRVFLQHLMQGERPVWTGSLQPLGGPSLPVTLVATVLSPAYSVIPRLLWGVREGHLA